MDIFLEILCIVSLVLSIVSSTLVILTFKPKEKKMEKEEKIKSDIKKTIEAKQEESKSYASDSESNIMADEVFNQLSSNSHITEEPESYEQPSTSYYDPARQFTQKLNKESDLSNVLNDFYK